MRPCQCSPPTANLRCSRRDRRQAIFPRNTIHSLVNIIQRSSIITHPFTQPPVNHQILGQVHRNDHPASVVHPPRPSKLAHRSVHDWEASTAFTPSSKVLCVVGPFNVGILGLERLVHAARIKPSQVRLRFWKGWKEGKGKTKKAYQT